MQKRDFKGIHDRFLRDHVFRERMIENNRDEEVCRASDVLAEQDLTYRMSESEYFHYRQNWWISLNKSGTIHNQWENVLTLNKHCLHWPVYTKKLEDNNSSQCSTGSTRNGNRHRVLPPPGGNGQNPGGLPKNSKKVKKEAASKGLRSNGVTRYLQNFGKNLRQMAFKNSFYFVTDGSFTADVGLLWPTRGVRQHLKTPVFAMWKIQEFGIQIEWTMTGHNRTTTPRRKELCTFYCVCVVKCSWRVKPSRWTLRRPTPLTTWKPRSRETSTRSTTWTRECARSCHSLRSPCSVLSHSSRTHRMDQDVWVFVSST